MASLEEITQKHNEKLSVLQGLCVMKIYACEVLSKLNLSKDGMNAYLLFDEGIVTEYDNGYTSVVVGSGSDSGNLTDMRIFDENKVQIKRIKLRG